jgi:hypothetical protein
MNWIIARAREASTWRGIFVLLGIIGYTINPAIQDQIITVIFAVLGLLEVVRNERDTAIPVQIQLPPIELVGRSVSPPETGQSRMAESTHPVVDSDIASHSRVSVQPDYRPKEPKQPVDFPVGWNG